MEEKAAEVDKERLKRAGEGNNSGADGAAALDDDALYVHNDDNSEMGEEGEMTVRKLSIQRHYSNPLIFEL